MINHGNYPVSPTVRIVIWIIIESRNDNNYSVRYTIFFVSDFYYTPFQMCHDRELSTLRLDGNTAKT